MPQDEPQTAVPLRVLVLDADEAGTGLMIEALRRGGYEPAWERINTEADYLGRLGPHLDVILADYSLPQLDALRALHLLHERRLDVPLVIVSGPVGAETAVAAMKEGAADFVLKDQLGRLGEVAAEALERRRFRDEQRQAEEALRQREERIRLLLDSTAEAVYAVDLAGRCTFCNRAGARLLGYADPAELLGRNMHALAHHTKADGSAYPESECPAHRAVRLGERAHVDGEVLWRADGTSFPAEYWSYPIRRGEELVGAVVTFLDVTERKLLEEQFLQSQKLESIGRLAGGVAHDFNNLLTIIIGYGEMGLMALPPENGLRETLTQILRASERAAGLTRQLLAFSRRQVLQPVTLDLNALVADVEKLLRRVIGEDVDLRVSPAAGLWPVKADPGKLEQVLVNLAVNARDAMPAGGKLTIETRNIPRMPAANGTSPANDWVLLTMTDTGIGMDARVKARLFEPFFTTKEVGKGTGLGLATVYGIVEQSGGRIEVQSEPGRGSTFAVYLPRDSRPTPASKSNPGAARSRQGKETILLVEDEAAVRTLTRMILEKQGYTVLEASGGAEALRLVEQHAGAIQLLITDVVMPQMSGPQVAEEVSRLRPGTAILYISGYTDEAVARHGMIPTGTPFLQKPFGAESLAKKVREVLDG